MSCERAFIEGVEGPLEVVVEVVVRCEWAGGGQRGQHGYEINNEFIPTLPTIGI